MSDKPVITPTADILRDDKAILVFAGTIIEMLINAVPALAPYSALLSLIVFLGFGLLVLHQSVEDLIYAWADAKTSVTTIKTPSQPGAIPADLSTVGYSIGEFQYAGYPPGVVPPVNAPSPDAGQGAMPGQLPTSESPKPAEPGTLG